MADKQYKRQLILHSNAYPQTHTLTVKVQTSSLPIEKRKIPSGGLIGLFLMTVVVAVATTWFITYAASAVASWFLQTSGYERILFLGIASLMSGSWMGYFALKRGDSVAVAVSMAVGTAVGGAMAGAMIGCGAVMGRGVGGAVEWVIDLAEDSFTAVLILLRLGFGASIGTGIIAGFLNPFILLALTATSLPALSMLVYSPLKRRRLIAKYCKSEKSLIKP
ncbi:MAG: hypothetical protein V7K37_15860 [Nostoc sp.]